MKRIPVYELATAVSKPVWLVVSDYLELGHVSLSYWVCCEMTGCAFSFPCGVVTVIARGGCRMERGVGGGRIDSLSCYSAWRVAPIILLLI